MDVRKLKKEVWPYQITINVTNKGVIDEWCERNLGRRFRDWYGYYSTDTEKSFAFKDEATLPVFKLRWSYNG